MKLTDTTISAFDGTDLHLRSWLPPAASAQLVLVHGVSEHVGRYEHVAEFFADRGFAVHGHDSRGHGLSGGPRLDVDRFDRYVDDLGLVIGRVHRSDRPLVVYGHSMGGLIATLHAESDRPQPDLYVLSAPALDAEAPKPFAGRGEGTFASRPRHPAEHGPAGRPALARSCGGGGLLLRSARPPRGNRPIRGRPPRCDAPGT